MIEQGLQSLFPMADLSVMGITEVLASLPKILKRMRYTIQYILDKQPDIVVTIDSPDFGLRVAKKVKSQNSMLKCIHYVAPTVWAWREGRAKKMARYLDAVLCLFPFEPPFFEKYSLPAHFVGHPLASTIPTFSKDEKNAFCEGLGLDIDKPIMCVLPGSRRSEIAHLLPVFAETCRHLKAENPDIQFIIPTLSDFTSDIENVFLSLRGKIIVPMNDHEKHLAFALSDVALHASGTVALELALCGTPMVTAYKVSTVSAFIGRMLVKTRFANLVNVLLKREVIRERLQESCVPLVLAHDVETLLTDPEIYGAQKQAITSLRGMLQAHENMTGEAAAHAVFAHIHSDI
jgi:lipid-A-disaccharide synthase